MRGMTLLEIMFTLSLSAFFSLCTLRNWQQQQQQQRLSLEESSLALINFLSQVQALAHHYNQTLIVKQRLDPDRSWCLSASVPSLEMRSEQALLYFVPSDHSVQLNTEPIFPTPLFYGASATARATRLSLQNGPFGIRIIISSKGRLSRCSEKGYLTGLRPC